MFERYSERARRALFFARYELARAGGLSIEPEHLLLGALRESPRGLVRFFKSGETAGSIRSRLESALVPAERISTSVEVPFSESSKEVLTQTVVEADALKNEMIRTEHMILAILAKTNGTAARVLRDAGIDPDAIRASLRGTRDDPADRPGAHSPPRVARQWRGVVKPGRADAYLTHLQQETVPSLRRIAGFSHVAIMRREVEDGTEFQVTTYWQSLDAIEAFAGDDVTHAVVPPSAQALMVRYDERSVHYDLVH
jgi:ATP-dependent Clp protease ATP-binding subunit ClpC